jgi:uncharacterized membrane protein YdjX (TVP38/TMEM64 family)
LPQTAPSPPPSWRRYGALAALLAALALILLLRLDRWLSLDELQRQRQALDLYIAHHRLTALAIYVAVYIAGVAVSLPTLLVMSIAGGYLFGVWTGFGAAWISANIGAIIIFLALRSAVGGVLRRAVAPWLSRFESSINNDAFFYLLTLRLIPPLPFWVVNLGASCFEVKLRDFIVATMIGIVPVTFAFVTVGAALREALDAGAALDPAHAAQRILGSPEFIVATIALIALALLPVAYKRRRRVSNQS